MARDVDRFPSLAVFEANVLAALVDGYRARAAMKVRNRYLSEYEIARRAELTNQTYVEFSMSAERERLHEALGTLEHYGLVSRGERAGRYDTYVPTEFGHQTIARLAGSDLAAAPYPQPLPSPAPAAAPANAPLPPDTPAWAARLSAQLDEVIALLRALYAQNERRT
jgi:hypothetical protein